jgi:hypothetical protein
MGTLTIVLSDEVERKLRDAVVKRGSGKGTLSKIIEEALNSYFSSLEKKSRTFKAYKGNNLVGEAESLDELAKLLREKEIDARGLKIVSTETIKPKVRTGYRIK